MSTTAIAITSAANAQAVAANAAAQEAAHKACITYVRGYEHDRATVSEMREYAGCIDVLYPAPMTAEGLVVAKFAVLVIFAAMVVGVLVERKECVLSNGWFGAVLVGSVVGAVLGSVALLVVTGLWYGVRLLLT